MTLRIELNIGTNYFLSKLIISLQNCAQFHVAILSRSLC